MLLIGYGQFLMLFIKKISGDVRLLKNFGM